MRSSAMGKVLEASQHNRLPKNELTIPILNTFETKADAEHKEHKRGQTPWLHYSPQPPSV